jgi:hypothetical protein
MWTIGFLVAPSLFSTLSDNRQLAGQLAGQLFELIGWVGLACASYLLLFVCCARVGSPGAAGTSGCCWRCSLLGAISLFGVQPLLAQLKADALPREVMESVLRNRFAAWHGISSVLYLLQSLLGLLLVTTCGRSAR